MSSGNWIHETENEKKYLRFENPAGVRRHVAMIIKKYETLSKEEQIEIAPVVRTIGFMVSKLLEAFRVERENALKQEFDQIQAILRERGLL